MIHLLLKLLELSHLACIALLIGLGLHLDLLIDSRFPLELILLRSHLDLIELCITPLGVDLISLSFHQDFLEYSIFLLHGHFVMLTP
jgi:hypothetical protein